MSNKEGAASEGPTEEKASLNSEVDEATPSFAWSAGKAPVDDRVGHREVVRVFPMLQGVVITTVKVGGMPKEQ